MSEDDGSTSTSIGVSVAASSSSGTGGDGGTGGAPGAKLTLLSWNIENFPLSAQAEPGVRQIIETYHPDVIGFEEIADANAFMALAQNLPGYGAILNQDSPSAPQRVAILYDKARVGVDGTKTLFSDDSYAFPRPVLEAHISLLAEPGFDFDLLVVHLKATLDADSVARRKAACIKLDAWIRDELANGTEPDIMVAGDMNDEITDPPSQNVFGPFLDDPATYTFLTESAAKQGEFSYIPFQSFIDHALVTSGMLGEVGDGKAQVIHAETMLPDYVDSVSDHRPLLVTLDGIGD